MSRISYRATKDGTDHFELFFEDLSPVAQTELRQFIKDNGGDESVFKTGIPLCQFHSDQSNIDGYGELVSTADSTTDQGEPFVS